MAIRRRGAGGGHGISGIRRGSGRGGPRDDSNAEAPADERPWQQICESILETARSSLEFARIIKQDQKDLLKDPGLLIQIAGDLFRAKGKTELADELLSIWTDINPERNFKFYNISTFCRNARHLGAQTSVKSLIEIFGFDPIAAATKRQAGAPKDNVRYLDLMILLDLIMITEKTNLAEACRRIHSKGGFYMQKSSRLVSLTTIRQIRSAYDRSRIFYRDEPVYTEAVLRITRQVFESSGLTFEGWLSRHLRTRREKSKR